VGVLIFIYPLHNFHFKNSKNKDTSIQETKQRQFLTMPFLLSLNFYVCVFFFFFCNNSSLNICYLVTNNFFLLNKNIFVSVIKKAFFKIV
jgi:hypothetical protein